MRCDGREVCVCVRGGGWVWRGVGVGAVSRGEGPWMKEGAGGRGVCDGSGWFWWFVI